jgi:hypothetical protein
MEMVILACRAARSGSDLEAVERRLRRAKHCYGRVLRNSARHCMTEDDVRALEIRSARLELEIFLLEKRLSGSEDGELNSAAELPF